MSEKKKLKFLIVPLTSADITRLKRCLYTLERMFDTRDMEYDIEYDIHVVVNTKNSDYVGEVYKELGDDYKITVTPSDGTPGTGKNSVFDLFRKQRKKYDYLFQVDGDDFLYPVAMRQIAKLLHDAELPDVVSFQSMDWMSTNYTDKMSHAVLVPNFLWLFSWCNTEPNLREIPAFVYVTDPNFGKQGRIFTPGTSMILSRKFLKNFPSCRHTNKISLFEDYYYYLKLFKLHLDNKIKMVHTNNSFMYVYDKANIDSVSTNNCYYSDKEINMLRGYVKDNDMMQNNPKDDMDFITLGSPDTFELGDKVIWCRHLLQKFPSKLESLDLKKKQQEGRPHTSMPVLAGLKPQNTF